MDALTAMAALASPPYAVHIDVNDVLDDGHGEIRAEALAPATPSMPEAQEVEARLEAIAAQVEQTARHIAEHLSSDGSFLPGADIDTALRMPRGRVVRRKGTLRLVKPQTTVTSPTADQLAHLYGEDDGNAG